MTRYLSFLICFPLILLLTTLSFAKPDDPCSCKFDTTQYSAECRCSLVCSITEKNGKQCYITCNGEMSKQDSGFNPGNTALFGNYKEFTNEVTGQMQQYFNQTSIFSRSIWAMSTLPLVLRTSYISAPFLSDNQIKKIDDFVHKIFKEKGDTIANLFLNGQDTNFIVSLSKKFPPADVFVTKGKIRITLKQIDGDNIIVKTNLSSLR